MEIERKYLVRSLPDNIDSYPHDLISQAYICTDPVIRIRKKNDQFILTVKSSGLMVREEAEFALSEESFRHLMTKTEGNVIEKVRYKIPLKDGLMIELDIFHGVLEGFIMAEVEFPDISTANDYIPPRWFGREVTSDFRYSNSSLSHMSADEAEDLIHS